MVSENKPYQVSLLLGRFCRHSKSPHDTHFRYHFSSNLFICTHFLFHIFLNLCEAIAIVVVFILLTQVSKHYYSHYSIIPTETVDWSHSDRDHSQNDGEYFDREHLRVWSVYSSQTSPDAQTAKC